MYTHIFYYVHIFISYIVREILASGALFTGFGPVLCILSVSRQAVLSLQFRGPGTDVILLCIDLLLYQKARM